MIKHAELEYVIKPYLEIGMFYPKSGDIEDITVVTFYISEEEALKDVTNFINYMPIKTLIDVSYSNYIDEDGYYLIFIELTNGDETFNDIVRILYELMSISDKDEWDVKVYKNKKRTYEFKDIQSFFLK